jgi:hypothetical protein
MSSFSYRLKLLGPCRVVTADGEPVEVSRGKPLALLAYLALTADPPSRNQLARLLWPDSSRTRARGSLRQALWQLRNALGEDVFEEDDPVVLAPETVTTDVEELRNHLRAGRLQQAFEWSEGPLFEDLRIPDAPVWERWADELRRELERQLGSALADRGNREREISPGPSAALWLERAVRVQPSRLQHHLDLAEAHLEIRAFDRARDVLAEARRRFDDPAAQEDLNALRDRVDQLQRGSPILPSTGAGALRLQFTGRSHEFASLVRRWNLVREGEAGLGLILGEAGIGKTRLAEEVALLARGEGARVVQVKADDSERPIEWALLGEIVRRLLALSGAAGISGGSQEVLRTLLPSLPRGDVGGPPPDGLTLTFPRTRPSAALSDALQDLISAVSEDAPLVLIVDDLQWADGESRAVLTRAATRMDQTPVLFLITSRTGGREISPRIGKTLNILARGDGSVRVDLEALSTEETRTLLLRTLRAPEERELKQIIDRIIRSSRGNPLFVVELLKVLRDQGIVTEEEEHWRVHPERIRGELPLPDSLREIIDRQLDQLSQQGSLVAAHLARTRHPVAPRVIASRTGLSQGALTDGVSELLQRRIVQWESGEKLAFAHDELRAAVSRRYQLHVGLTTGGGTTWSLFRSAVVASLLLLLVGAAVYALRDGPLPSAPPLGGGPLLVFLGSDSVLEARSPVSNPVGGWTFRPSATSASLPVSPVGSHFNGTGERLVLPTTSAHGARTLELHPRPEGGTQADVIHPGGDVIDTRTWDRVHGAAWCEGANPPTLFLSVESEGAPRLVRWTPDGEVEELSPEGIPGSVVTCSPNGRYGAAMVALGGELSLRLLDLATGDGYTVPVPDPHRIRGLHWDWEHPPAVPAAVAVEHEGPMTLEWGERSWVRAQVVHSDGSRSRAPVDWSSQSPQVASVTPTGRVMANHPGETVLFATFDGWLTDSLRVEVREGSRPPVLLSDSSPPGDEELWEVALPPPGQAPRSGQETGIGSESMAGAEPEAGPLPISGGWRSTEDFDLSSGATLEAEILLPQAGGTLRLCLAPGGDETTSQPRDGQALCLRLTGPHSGAELPSTPARAALEYHPAFPSMPLELPGAPDEGGTVSAEEDGRVSSDPEEGQRMIHVALALLPDGTGVIYMDRREAGRSPVRLSTSEPQRWRVTLRSGGIAGGGPNHGLDQVRNLVLWPDVRF